MKFNNHKLYKTWIKVPVDYYQKGVKKNILQWIWHTHKIFIAKKIIKALKFKNLLDIGCASGYMLDKISQDYPKARYFGIDVYDKAITTAKNNYPNLNFKNASADKLPFKKNSFDVVICYETIEHMENPKKALEEIRRIMKENGSLILAMDSGNTLFKVVWWVWEHSWGIVWKDSHLHPFHHSKLEDLIKSVPFKVKKKYFSHFGMEVIFVLNK